MGWLFVALAAGCEVTGVVGLNKYSQKKTIPTGLLYFSGFGLSFVFLYASFHYLQVSTAYAVWIGIGTAGAVVLNMIFFGESKSLARLGSLALIIIGVVGLKALS
ncbi:DMT family transporter [Sporosarcina aquimarina]|uniref:Multidrug efflux SMR transporter n=1 Tax=Sporosarcina aquimarina TaxID=114975 RepID=A0ABU4G1R1_9BACL|nr:multidrug efflux SMR transporter [Sporosarcina aquimarina]MDW0110258.1 multidrug efflux SMR transporter [Sporosarcina aquimarina]